MIRGFSCVLNTTTSIKLFRDLNLLKLLLLVLILKHCFEMQTNLTKM